MARLRVLATFEDEARAQRAAAVMRATVPSAFVRAIDDRDAVDALRAGQRAELDESLPLAPAAIVTGPQVRGALAWGLPGLVGGLLLGLIVGALAPVDEAVRVPVLVASMGAGALALGTWLAVYGAGRGPVIEGELDPVVPGAVVDVELAPELRQTVDRTLVRSGAVEVFHWTVTDAPPRP